MVRLNNYLNEKYIMEVDKINTATSSGNQSKPDFYILIYNIQKYRNIGTIIRSASAFNVKAVFVYANKKVLKKFYGNQNTTKTNEFIFFDSLETIKKYCKDNSITICGIEITENSKPVQSSPFLGNTLFVFGNEGTGLSDKQKQLCDYFVYIQQYSNRTGSLNVAIAASIVFHHFAVFAGYTPASFTQEKYETASNYDRKNKEITFEDLLDEKESQQGEKTQNKKEETLSQMFDI